MEILRPEDFEAKLNPSTLIEDLNSSRLGRRVFIKGLGFVSVALLVGTMGGCDALADAIKNRPVRRRLRSGSPEVDADIETYRQGVQLMKDLDTSNPSDQRSWKNQAAIHGITTNFTYCEHGSDHFFDWHRAYLFSLERIIQKLTGKPKWGLPYWNWNHDPDIHSAFLDQNSTLYKARTRTSMNGSTSDTTAELDPIFADTNFFTFSHQLEGTPHNDTHTYIGGTFGGYASANDPLFFMHHCMIDYCWAKWNVEMGNNNTNDANWLNHDNSHFVDADGNPISFSAAATTLMLLFSYRYESSAIGSHSAQLTEITSKAEFAKLEKRIRAGANIRFDIKQRFRLADKAAISVARPMSHETQLTPQDFAAIINSDSARERIFASIEFAELPPLSDFYVRVFVNLPTATTQTSTEDPHYAGSFAFFGGAEPGITAVAGGGHQHQQKFLVNLTNAIQRLRKNQELREGTPLSVQLVPVPFSGKFEKEDAELLLNGIDIIVTPVTINSPPQ
ncbi:MAG TPA: tyrosinase family protein [Pyrinomonadaceae bacterium]|nr:tyrosinase family protein [Pyrinomonadaceae bacterium]